MAEETQPDMPALDQFIAGLLELPEGTPSDKALDILAWTLLGEAAGEGKEGMAAVAHVIKNRAESGLYPADVQRVALQPKQFSTWNKGQGGNNPQSRFSKDSAEFQEARGIAADVVSGRHKDPTGGAIYYWSPAGMKAMGKVAPSWADDVTGSAGRVKIGGHVFVAEHPVNPTAPTPLDKPQRVAMIQAVNDVLGNRPLPAPAPLDPNNPMRQPGALAAGAKPGTRTGDFSTETRYAAGAAKSAAGELTYQPPNNDLKPATVVRTAAIDPNTGYPPKPFEVSGGVGLGTGARASGSVDYSPALAAGLARLGAQVATKAKIDLGQPKVGASASVSGSSGVRRDASTSINLNNNPGVVRTANAPEQQPIPRDVRPSSLPTVEELASLTKKPAARPNTTPQGPQSRGSAAPQYITKTRQVLVEEPKASLKAGSGGLGAGAGAALKPISISGGGTAMLGAKGAGGGALTYSAPKKPTYRTETYQVPNPAYVAPNQSELNMTRGKELLARQQAAKAAAAIEKKRQEEAAKAAAQAAAQAAPMYLSNGVANPAYRDYSGYRQSEGGGQAPSYSSGTFTDSLGGVYHDRNL